jgi:hypothetical protein
VRRFSEEAGLPGTEKEKNFGRERTRAFLGPASGLRLIHGSQSPMARRPGACLIGGKEKVLSGLLRE